MQNIETRFEGTKLIIEIDTSKILGTSDTGKSILIATTRGNAKIGEGLTLGVNLYKKNPDYKPSEEGDSEKLPAKGKKK